MFNETGDNKGMDTNGSERLNQLAEAQEKHVEDGRSKSPVPARKNKGGRPRNDGLPPGSVGTSSSSKPKTSTQVETSTLFTPKIMGPVFRVPFLLISTKTNSKTWLLDKDEEEVLADSGAATLNAFCPMLDQRWAALTALSLAIITIAGGKMVAYVGEQKVVKPTPEPVLTVAS